VEVVTSGVVAVCDQNLDASGCMAHVELDGSASVGPLRTVAGDCVLATTGVVDEEIFVEAAGGGIDEVEVGGDEGSEEEGKEGC